jgi:molybdenum-dependent DNA-binding transcriptional regulator ModE
MRTARLGSIDFNTLRLFVTVATSGSIAAACRDLRISPSKGTRLLGALEDALSALARRAGEYDTVVKYSTFAYN